MAVQAPALARTPRSDAGGAALLPPETAPGSARPEAGWPRPPRSERPVPGLGLMIIVNPDYT